MFKLTHCLLTFCFIFRCIFRLECSNCCFWVQCKSLRLHCIVTSESILVILQLYFLLIHRLAGLAFMFSSSILLQILVRLTIAVYIQVYMPNHELCLFTIITLIIHLISIYLFSYSCGFLSHVIVNYKLVLLLGCELSILVSLHIRSFELYSLVCWLTTSGPPKTVQN